MLAQWGVRSRHGEWSDEETQLRAARAVLSEVDRYAPTEDSELVSEAELERLRMAEEVCWSLLIWIALDKLNRIPLGVRKDIAENSLGRWAELCAQQGLMRQEKPEAETS